MKQLAQEDEIKDQVRRRYAKAGREPPIEISIEHREDPESNWTARTDPQLRNFDDRRDFLAVVFQVQRLYDLAVD
jgi:hypothetical protein